MQKMILHFDGRRSATLKKQLQTLQNTTQIFPLSPESTVILDKMYSTDLPRSLVTKRFRTGIGSLGYACLMGFRLNLLPDSGGYVPEDGPGDQGTAEGGAAIGKRLERMGAAYREYLGAVRALSPRTTHKNIPGHRPPKAPNEKMNQSEGAPHGPASCRPGLHFSPAFCRKRARLRLHRGAWETPSLLKRLATKPGEKAG